MLNQNVYLCWSSCCYIVLCWKTISKWNQLVVTVEKIYCFYDTILVTLIISKTCGCMGVSHFYLIYHIPSIVHFCLKHIADFVVCVSMQNYSLVPRPNFSRTQRTDGRTREKYGLVSIAGVVVRMR